MAGTLPRLRLDLDFMPSPLEDRPGLLVRDPMHYSPAMLVIPPFLVRCLELFDGESTEADLRERLVRLTGQLDVGDVLRHLVEALGSAGFLEDETFEELKNARRKAFADSPQRIPAHAGSAYPDQPGDLRSTMDEWMSGADGSPAPNDGLVGIAAPHVSPAGGWESYRDAYRLLTPAYGDRTFIILGTSHYGAPDRFGLTRKSFLTPWGEAQTDTAMVDFLARRASASIEMEDYCHSVEHSIEFQVVFLQSIYGPGVKVLPILCGSFGRSIYLGGQPEDTPEVKQFFEALGELVDREAHRTFWVLGIDMAHMGQRYGDNFAAKENEGRMAEVASRDKDRIEKIAAGDPEGFWDEIKRNQDDLKWCGSAPLYTFLRTRPGVKAHAHRYQQWNIDENSVVTFAALSLQKD